MEHTSLSSENFSNKLNEFKAQYHSQCLFNNNPPVKQLTFNFKDDGTLCTKAIFEDIHQSYDGRVHGGLIAAIIDASMTQCLMGHSIIAYTVDLSIKYKKAVSVFTGITFKTEIVDIQRNKIFKLVTSVFEDDEIVAQSEARFFGEMKELTA